MICSVDDCNKPARARELCNAHYLRVSRRGNLKPNRPVGMFGQPIHRQAKSKSGPPTSEYKAWISMKYRCLNPSCKVWKYYGARGISICEEWIKSFEKFFADVGPKPGPQYSLDRIDNNLGYFAGNCRWATARQQQLNRRRDSK